MGLFHTNAEFLRIQRQRREGIEIFLMTGSFQLHMEAIVDSDGTNPLFPLELATPMTLGDASGMRIAPP